jgi:hypothetical protein
MPKRPTRRFNTSMTQPLEGGGWKLRVWSRPKVGKMSPRLTIRCGCCTNGFQIYHDKEGLEIGGVYAPMSEWRAILEPLLNGRAPRPAAAPPRRRPSK